MSISIWMLCDPGLSIPFSEHMENHCMQMPGSDEEGFRAILVDTSGLGKQWDVLKLLTPVKTGGTLCCTAGGAVSQHLKASNPAQLPAARPCLITARTALICCSTSFISSHFYFMKKRKYPTMHWAVEISIFIFISFLCSITLISLRLPLSLTACTSKLSIMICGNVCVPRCFSHLQSVA